MLDALDLIKLSIASGKITAQAGKAKAYALIDDESDDPKREKAKFRRWLRKVGQSTEKVVKTKATKAKPRKREDPPPHTVYCQCENCKRRLPNEKIHLAGSEWSSAQLLCGDCMKALRWSPVEELKLRIGSTYLLEETEL